MVVSPMGFSIAVDLLMDLRHGSGGVNVQEHGSLSCSKESMGCLLREDANKDGEIGPGYSLSERLELIVVRLCFQVDAVIASTVL